MKRFIITSITLNILSFHSHCANWDGAGTEDDPFRISTSQQLAELAEEVNNGTDFYNEFFVSQMISIYLRSVMIP